MPGSTRVCNRVEYTVASTVGGLGVACAVNGNKAIERINNAKFFILLVFGYDKISVSMYRYLQGVAFILRRLR